MSKGLIGFIAVVVILGIWSVSAYNGLVKKDVAVNEAWSKVETQYQRRADLIGNLVKTVQGAADFERTTLNDVITARSKATSITIDPSNITPEQLQQFEAAQGQMMGALSRLLATFERYPELKATDAFRDLMAETSGTENRVGVARDRFNESVKSYNQSVRSFPTMLYAGAFGFDRKPYFESKPGSEDAPDVDFSFE